MSEWFKRSPVVPENLKVVGVPKEESKKILLIRQKATEKRSDLLPYELQKPKELLENISVLNKRLADFFTARGLTWRNVSENRIHLVDYKRLSPDRRAALGENIAAFHEASHGRVVLLVKGPDPEKKLQTHLHLVHEMIHASAFLSFQPQKNPDAAYFTMSDDAVGKEKNYYTRRQGMRIATPPNDRAFNAIDEAIVEELAKQFDRSGGLNGLDSIKDDWINRQDALLTGQMTEEGRRLVEDVAHVTYTSSKEGKRVYALHRYEYKDERVLLDDVVANIQKKSPTRFPKKTGVFQLFVEAEMNGHLLPIARAVEEVYGKGSFRRLAEWNVEKQGAKFK